jgi:hypothetical protein
MTGSNVKQGRQWRGLRSQLKERRLVIILFYFVLRALGGHNYIPNLIYYFMYVMHEMYIYLAHV